MSKIKSFIKSQAVLIISALAAFASAFFVFPSKKYLDYIDFQVLALLFCFMIIVAGLKKSGLFIVIAQKMTAGSKNLKMLSLFLILISFFSSMFITNDVSLITFIPFTILVLTMIGQTDRLIFVIVMQTVAANLGSLLTPVGNPQNLYLYSFYHINALSFFKITVPIALVSLVLIVAFSLIGKNKNIKVNFVKTEKISDYKLLYLYIFLFLLCMLTVFHFIHYGITFIIVSVAVLFTSKSLYKFVDYYLLATFVCFFIFVGNISNIGQVHLVLANFIEKRELICSVILSQLISNVPAAVLLSNLTNNYTALLTGTNIGGLGTLIASLASLISFQLYIKTKNAKPFKYIIIFTLINFVMLAILLAFSLMII